MKLEPRRVEESEIREWPKMAWRLLRREATAWILLVLLGQVFTFFLSLHLLLLGALWPLWWLLAVAGLVLVQKADQQYDWATALRHYPCALYAYRKIGLLVLQVAALVLVLLWPYSEDLGDLLVFPYPSMGSEQVLGSFLYTPMAVLGMIVVLSHSICWPLQFVAGVDRYEVKEYGAKCDKVNRGNIVSWVGRNTFFVGMGVFLLLVPVSILLWPLVAALSYVACREVFSGQAAKTDQA